MEFIFHLLLLVSEKVVSLQKYNVLSVIGEMSQDETDDVFERIGQTIKDYK